MRTWSKTRHRRCRGFGSPCPWDAVAGLAAVADVLCRFRAAVSCVVARVDVLVAYGSEFV